MCVQSLLTIPTNSAGKESCRQVLGYSTVETPQEPICRLEGSFMGCRIRWNRQFRLKDSFMVGSPAVASKSTDFLLGSRPLFVET